MQQFNFDCEINRAVDWKDFSGHLLTVLLPVHGALVTSALVHRYQIFKSDSSQLQSNPTMNKSLQSVKVKFFWFKM